MSEAAEWDVIIAYTRADAIEDGVLVDVSEWAGPTGMRPSFRCPVAVTAAVWADLNAIPEKKRHQDLRGRAHDLLWMALCAIRRDQATNPLPFQLYLDVAGERRRLRTYQIHLGPGDEGEWVATIMRPGED